MLNERSQTQKTTYCMPPVEKATLQIQSKSMVDWAWKQKQRLTELREFGVMTIILKLGCDSGYPIM